MLLTRKKESDAYRAARAELLVAEQNLLRQIELVAEMRRALPVDTAAGEYTFHRAGSRGEARRSATLDELVIGNRPLIIYHFMWGKAQTDPCPMCTLWVTGLNAIADYAADGVDLAVVAAAPAADLDRYAAANGWDRIPLLSAVDSTFKYDYGSEDERGNQDPAVSVFRRRDGIVHHTYTGHAQLGPDHWRGLDLLAPIWHLHDLAPDGRGDWMPSLPAAATPGSGR